ncbi:MAG: ATP phosphoribosyltransferase regulatory subunit [Henriciella sp.]
MSVASLAVEAFAAQGGEFVEPPILMEAAIPLELSGEAVRNRICTFTDAQGREWALRPDLTLPVAIAELEQRRTRALGETTRRYKGRVFRLPSLDSEPVEYEQIGLERFGAPRGVDEDVWLFESVIAACQAGGVKTGFASFGDLSIFPAFVDALGFADDIASGLKRAFRQEGGVKAYIEGQERNRSGLAGRVAGMSADEISAFVDDIFAMTGIRPVGERGGDEIVQRLVERSKSGAAFSISKVQSDTLNALLTLDLKLADAPDALASLAEAAKLNGLEDQLARFAERAKRLAEISEAVLGQPGRFATRFGRRFTYYDGLVFEIAAHESEMAMKRPFAAGGRYDSLLSALSQGDVSATALGGIIIPHRVSRTVGGDL